MTKTITLAHGNGGEENNELIKKVFYKHFENDILAKSEDAAIIEEGKLAFTTDSFTVSPLFFPGGDIGKLAVCGTCNDLAMMGAKPKYLTCSVIIEEGFSTRELEKIVKSMKKELDINGAIVVSGDTKVVPKGSVDKLFINTTGIGEIQHKEISASALKEDMSILVSRDIGTHGATIFAAREGIELTSTLQTDCASLYPEIKKLIDSGINIVAMRDATRGGVSAVLNEWAKSSDVCIEVKEENIPVQEEVRGICEMLGFEALNLANEGTFLLAVSKEDESKALKVLQETHNTSTLIASVSTQYKGRVLLNSSWGTKRFLDLPTGELLPRIC
ncbi:hydrogenase expression/formation protein HypE [Poseidonibacter lekithochrous]|uniref:hydrogenase expression/formation protein HypE n=1 Tax=Poseidonibacter TaxID=2321187 RepID=UPI001C09A424|nr:MULTISPECIES: hydrogenase expression/formation protein HypE [Poseidonibacter]MBU3013926.1 hydrogenase expression/formation protein HypE [Poseidonibacter lekithochrous]MDO6827221.1 hydrogenase expression/formation protein HypE [Poseidonibacter sp. 1_MG-2023]